MDDEKINKLMTIMSDIQKNIAVMSVAYQHDHDTLERHEKLLVRGNGEPGLVYTVRRLETTVEGFIARMQRVEEEKRRRDEELKIKLTLAFIGFGIPAIAGFIWQFIVFWVKIAPSLEAAAGK